MTYIAIIGDRIVDVYIHGRFDKGQDGCPKFVESDRIKVPGGAANAFNSLKHCDVYAMLYSNELPNAPIKTRFLVNDKIVWRHDYDVMSVCNGEREDRLQALITLKPDAVLICDYDKGFLTPELISRVITYAADRSIPCVVDAKREPTLYRGAILKCNNVYADKYNVIETPSFVVTNGERAPIVCSCGNLVAICPDGPPVKCVNHVGAGDCFAAHLTLALAQGMFLDDAAAYAHDAGRAYVQHFYNRAPYPSEISGHSSPLKT